MHVAFQSNHLNVLFPLSMFKHSIPMTRTPQVQVLKSFAIKKLNILNKMSKLCFFKPFQIPMQNEVPVCINKSGITKCIRESSQVPFLLCSTLYFNAPIVSFLS